VFRSADSLPSSEVLLPTTLPAGPRRCVHRHRLGRYHLCTAPDPAAP
jgi:hypothetical protein